MYIYIFAWFMSVFFLLTCIQFWVGEFLVEALTYKQLLQITLILEKQAPSRDDEETKRRQFVSFSSLICIDLCWYMFVA